MFPNNMTGDPNLQNPQSVFGYETYPPPPNSQNLNWPDVRQNPSFVNPYTFQFTQVHNCPRSETGLGSFQFNTQPPTQQVVQFPFQIGSSFGTTTTSLRCKRKTDSPPPQQCKQHITEEKMAEHMAKLHISSETASSSTETESAKEQRLYMCEEMRKLKSDSILPQCLLDKVQRPCTALVLWQPPPKILGLYRREENNRNIDENVNNNANCVPDQHQIDEIDIDNLDSCTDMDI